MKVKTVRAHQNVHGKHEVGDEYDHRKPETDIAFGYVEDASQKSRAKRKAEVAMPVDEPAAFDPLTDEV